MTYRECKFCGDRFFFTHYCPKSKIFYAAHDTLKAEGGPTDKPIIKSDYFFKPTKETEMEEPAKVMTDSVNHPTHYNKGKIEVIEFIEDQGLGYHLGNAVKYISRAGLKDPKRTIEDLEKAVWYIRRHIALASGNPPRPNEMPQERSKR